MEVVTLDIETRRLAAECPNGWKGILNGESPISALVAWSSTAERPFLFDENTLTEAASLLETADLILSFNGVRFDIPVLESRLGRKLALPQHLDLFQLVRSSLFGLGRSPKGYTLSELCLRALGTGKTGNALLAPQLADQGMWAILFDYCLTDVILTRKLFRYAQKHGGLIDLSGDLLSLDLPSWFTEVPI